MNWTELLNWTDSTEESWTSDLHHLVFCALLIQEMMNWTLLNVITYDSE